MISTGNKVTVNKNIESANGMLYKGTKVKVIIVVDKVKDIQVSDVAGRLFWIKSTDISV